MFRGAVCREEFDAVERPQDAVHMYCWMDLDNSKQVGERARGVVRDFVGRRKNPLQVYWS